jgi:hypothetical protein
MFADDVQPRLLRSICLDVPFELDQLSNFQAVSVFFCENRHCLGKFNLEQLTDALAIANYFLFEELYQELLLTTARQLRFLLCTAV